ncbi:MAG: heat-shock protein [Deltaproteobacteria bacterium]|nr:MAG: heat-shock protein [Deltaproteobacteria bacterium]
MELQRVNPRCNYGRSNSLPSFLDEFLPPLFNEAAFARTADRRGISVDIYDREGKVVIEAEIPGADKEELYVDVKGKHLTLGGERKLASEIKDENVYRRERHYGKFERSFTLPFEVKEELVSASYNNGILQLEISRPEEDQIKQIKIN